MKFSKESRVFEGIGLSKKEAQVLIVLLEKGSLTATELSREVERPRTSVILELENLRHEGLIERIKVGGHYEWQAVTLEEMDTLISEKYDSFKNALPIFAQLLKTQPIKKQFAVKIFSGESGLLKAYYKLLRISSGQRVYVFEGTQSLQSKMLLSNTHLVRWQNAFRASGVIIEVIGSVSSLGEVKRRGSGISDALKNRKMIYYDVPVDVVNFPCDVAVLPTAIILFIPKQETAVIIENYELVVTFKRLFEGLKMIANKKDINQIIESL